MIRRKGKTARGQQILLDTIDNARSYTADTIDDLISMYPPGSKEYDHIIDRLYFYSDDDNRDWKNRTDKDGYTIIPTKYLDTQRREIPMDTIC